MSVAIRLRRDPAHDATATCARCGWTCRVHYASGRCVLCGVPIPGVVIPRPRHLGARWILAGVALFLAVQIALFAVLYAAYAGGVGR